MTWAERLFECAGCGDPVRKRAAASAEVRCINCAVQRSQVNALQQMTKSGEFYRRWVAGMERAARLGRTVFAIGDEIDRIG